ncbi:MAG: hypothetical protein IJR89_00930 [Clostridia bacterium]|nr:hypothetical protein [Clostridia bacterium]
MNRFREKLARFMFGRYGTYGYDALAKACNVALIVLAVLNLFVRHFLISLLFWGVFSYTLFRFLSRNIAARQKENAAFLRFFGRIRSFFSLTARRFRERKTNAYRKCPSCKATIRLPRKKGAHSVVCPRCKTKFEVKIR